MRGWLGAMAFAAGMSVGGARAETAAPPDTGDTADTGRYVDTAARAEKVHTQDVGCGAGAVGLLASAMLFGAKRRRGPARDTHRE